MTTDRRPAPVHEARKAPKAKSEAWLAAKAKRHAKRHPAVVATAKVAAATYVRGSLVFKGQETYARKGPRGVDRMERDGSFVPVSAAVAKRFVAFK